MRKIISSLLAATILASSTIFSGGQALAAAPYCQMLNPKPDSPAGAQLKELIKKNLSADDIVGAMLDPAQPMTPELAKEIYERVFDFVSTKYLQDEKIGHLAEYQHKYDGKLNSRKELDAAIADLIGSMNDRWTWYTSATDGMKHLLMAVSKQAPFGIGLRLQPDGTFMIEHVSFGTAAQYSGMREGDTVLSVNGRELKGMNKKEVDTLFYGSLGSSLKITSIQDGKTVENSYSITAPVANEAGVKLLENNLAYMNLPNFMDEKAFGELLNSLGGMAAETPGGLQGIVLDLRYNGGGRVDFAKTLIRVLMSEGIVIQEISRDGREVLETKTTLRPMNAYDRAKLPAEMIPVFKDLQSLPLVILVNGSSASASEITTGALMESRPNTTVIGEQSFGKFTEMLVTELPNCSTVAVTSGRYTTPSGKWLQNVGIAPDITVHNERGSREDAQMKAAIDFLKNKTALNPANVVQKPIDTKEYFGPVPERAQPAEVDTDYAQLAREHRTLLMQGGVGVVLFSLLGIYLVLSRRRKDEE